MLHVRYATQWPLSPLPTSLPVCLPACSSLPYPLLMVFLLSLITACISVSACICVCVDATVWVLLCHADLFQQLFNVKCESTWQAGAKKKALKTVAYICAMASPLALPTIRNVDALWFCGTFETTTVATWIIPASDWKPTFQPVNNSLTASLRFGGLVCLISLHIVHISCDLFDLLFNLVHLCVRFIINIYKQL